MKYLLLLFLLCFALSATAANATRLRYERFEGKALITGHGTCFAISDSQLLTAAHNVLDAKDKPYTTIIVEDDFGWTKCTVVKFSIKYDIALLQIDTPHATISTVLKLAEKDLLNGEVTLIGSKRGIPLAENKGIIVERHHQGTVRDCMKVDFDHGDSGGPVLNSGVVIGMAVAGVPKDGDLDHSVGLFIPVSIIKEFLNK